ncbi:GH17242 [Drosophila grimshawi]|uniref:GH17242 n=1 Tax=Drosophila grimshawi TaxID=7222 RepID=B4K2R4_DROGR|nr:GH17242 [Drosophila grimshawi]
MRAWLLLLAVLATFQTIVQVASTEDISTRFIAAIAPTTTTTTATATTKAIINNNTTTKRAAAATTTETTTTALAKAFKPFNELHLNNNNNHNHNNNNNNSSSDSDIKNNNKKSKHSKSATFKQFNEVHKTRTDQLENSKNSKNKHNNKHHKHNKLTNNKSKHNNNKMAIKELQQHKTESQAQTAIANVFALQAPQAASVSASTSASASIFQLQHGYGYGYGYVYEYDSVLGEFEVPGIADAIIAEDEPATYSSKEIIKDKVKPDPSTLVEIENSLLSLFNMKRPPKIDRSKIVIPEAMKKLYAQIMGHELDSVNIPKPGLLTKSANTVRSFTHKGESRFNYL